jgi:hypothetical protein
MHNVRLRGGALNASFPRSLATLSAERQDRRWSHDPVPPIQARFRPP